jgi:hypothetical protein
MKVYKYKTHPKAMLLNFADVNNLDEYLCIDFDGSSFKSAWSPPKLKTQYKRQYKDLPNFLSAKPVISARVKGIIEPYVSKEVEILSLLHDELELYMLNVTNLLDCIDWQRSIKSDQSGSIIRFDKQVFDFSKIPSDTYMFKIKEDAIIETYFTDNFKNLIEKHKIKGLDYSIEFDSEFTLEKEQELQRKFEATLRAIEQYDGEVFSFEEGRKRVEQGKAFASGTWKMQLTNKGEFVLGQLQQDLSYSWLSPIYIPPVLLGYMWHEVERSGSS